MFKILLAFFCIFLTQCQSLSPEKSELTYTDLAEEKVLILGDSITQKGTYVSYIDYYLQKQKPYLKYDLTSIGLSSETASGISEPHHPFPRPCIHSRLERALVEIKPTVLMVCYGMNDGIYRPLDQDILTAYQVGIDKLIQKARDHGVKSIILNAPPYFDKVVITHKTKPISYDDFGFKTPYEDYNQSLIQFGLYLAKLAQENDDISYIDLNTPMADYIKTYNEHLSSDGVHPNSFGHFVMASIILNKLGIQIPQSQEGLKSAFDETEQSPLFKLVDKRRALNSTSWLNYIGYTRGNKTIKTKSITQTVQTINQLQEDIDKLKL